MPIVIQRSLIRDFLPSFSVFSGACVSILVTSFSWNRLKLSLAFKFDKSSGQFALLMSWPILPSAMGSNFLCVMVLCPLMDLF